MSQAGARALFRQMGGVTAVVFPAAPIGLTATSIIDGAVLAWPVPTNTDTQIVIETAPDVAGAPGTWSREAVTQDVQYTLSLTNGPRWVRLRALLYGRLSEAPASPTTGAVLASPLTTGAQVVGDIDTVAQDLIAETEARISAVQAEADARAQALLDEAAARNAAISQEVTDRNAAIQVEADARAAAILNERNDWTAAITTEQTVRQTEDDSLATEISLVAAGSGSQFDSKKIWYFDTDLEAWGGNGAPTVVDGWLRPADHATEPYLISPLNLGIEGQSYRFTKARIKKTGAPVWDGRLYWRLDSSQAWDVARSATIPEPEYNASGVGTIEWSDLAWWPGTLYQIRLDLSHDQSAANYFLVDWIAVGRPTPGAGVALVQDETTARIQGDAAEATQRTTLATQMRGDYTGTDVASVTQGLIYSERQARSSADSTEVTARELLSTKVVGTTAPGSLTLATLSAGLLYDERQARSSADSTEVTARELLSTKVTGAANPSSLTLATLSAGLLYDERQARSSADSTEVTARQLLSTKVIGTNDPNSVTLATLSTGLLYDERQARSSADSSEVTARQNLAATLTGFNDPTGKTLADISTGLIAEEKNARVTQDSAHTSDLTALKAALGGADASAFTQLQADVDIAETNITANSDAITQVQATVGDHSATITEHSATLVQIGGLSVPLADPSFELQDQWSNSPTTVGVLATACAYQSSSSSADYVHSGRFAYRVNADASTRNVYNPAVAPVVTGKRYRVTFWARTWNGNPAVGSYIRATAYQRDADRVFVAYGANIVGARLDTNGVAFSWTKVTGIYTAPAGIHFVQFSYQVVGLTAGDMLVDDYRVEEITESDEISYAQWSVTVDVNGYATGMYSVNNGTYSVFGINTDYFGVFKPGGGNALTWTNGVLSADQGGYSFKTGVGFGSDTDKLVVYYGPAGTAATRTLAGSVFGITASGKPKFGSVGANYGGGWSTAPAISYSVPSVGSPATVTVTVSSCVYVSNGVSISYNSSQVNISQTRETTVKYYLYYDDGGMAGGTKSLLYTTVRANRDTNPGYMFLGDVTVTTPPAGTVGSGNGTQFEP